MGSSATVKVFVFALVSDPTAFGELLSKIEINDGSVCKSTTVLSLNDAMHSPS
jgi:hypothetical protein